MDGNVLFTSPLNGVPMVPTPFSVLLDAQDADWAHDESLVRLGRALLHAGCRYFVCFGQNSEDVHDRLDNLIIDGGFEGVMTTWHDDESEVDVAEFLLLAAESSVLAAVVFVRDSEKWRRAFDAIPAEE